MRRDLPPPEKVACALLLNGAKISDYIVRWKTDSLRWQYTFRYRIWSCPYKGYNQQRDPFWFTSDILPAFCFYICVLYRNSAVHVVFYPDYHFDLASFCFAACYPAAVLLRQFIKHHWQQDEENFVPHGMFINAPSAPLIPQLQPGSDMEYFFSLRL